MRIGVLALQGAFVEHVEALEKLGVEATTVRLPAELKRVDGLIIPGGESTTISKLMGIFELAAPLEDLARSGFPILGTCAGMICLSAKASNSNHLVSLELMDIEVRRNAFGRQVDSFEVELHMPVLGSKPFPGVFIRAPLIEKVGTEVEVLARLADGTVVAARQGNLLATAFHPELTTDTRLHDYFVKMVSAR